MTSTQHCIKHSIHIYYIIIIDFVGICIASLYEGDVVSASHSQGLRIHALFDLVKAPCVSSGNICCNHWFLFDDGWTLPATTMGSCLYTKTMKKCIYIYMLCILYIYVYTKLYIIPATFLKHSWLNHFASPKYHNAGIHAYSYFSWNQPNFHVTLKVK